MAVRRARRAETLFVAGPKARLTRKLEMLESCGPKEAGSQRFVLAGLVATLDPECLALAVDAVSRVIRRRLEEMPDDQ